MVFRGLVLVWLTCSTASAVQFPDDPVLHWVGLFPGDFDYYNYVDNEYVSNGRVDSWIVDLRSSPEPSAVSLGAFEITYSFNEGFDSYYVAHDPDTPKVPVSPHIDYGKSGYGPWFHWTVLAIDKGWVEIQLPNGGGKVWADFNGAFEGALEYMYIEKGSVYLYKEEKIVVEHINYDGLIVKPEQDADFHCGNETLKFQPYQTYEIPIDQWIDDDGRSRFEVVYWKGC